MEGLPEISAGGIAFLKGTCQNTGPMAADQVNVWPIPAAQNEVIPPPSARPRQGTSSFSQPSHTIQSRTRPLFRPMSSRQVACALTTNRNHQVTSVITQVSRTCTALAFARSCCQCVPSGTRGNAQHRHASLLFSTQTATYTSLQRGSRPAAQLRSSPSLPC